MFEWVLFGFTAIIGAIIIYHAAARRELLRRVEALEEDQARYAEVVAKIAEVQTRTLEKFSGRFEEVEERMLDLSVPSQNPEMPLEKRHQVLALAQKGVPLDEIVERVKSPVGEAELILNLRKYRSGLKNSVASGQRMAAHA